MASGADQVMSRPASGMMPGLPRIDDQEMRTVVAAQLKDGRRSKVRRQLGENYYDATYVELRIRKLGVRIPPGGLQKQPLTCDNRSEADLVRGVV